MTSMIVWCQYLSCAETPTILPSVAFVSLGLMWRTWWNRQTTCKCFYENNFDFSDPLQRSWRLLGDCGPNFVNHWSRRLGEWMYWGNKTWSSGSFQVLGMSLKWKLKVVVCFSLACSAVCILAKIRQRVELTNIVVWLSKRLEGRSSRELSVHTKEW